MLSVFCLNDTAPTEIYPLSLHDALPISTARITEANSALLLFALLIEIARALLRVSVLRGRRRRQLRSPLDRKSTRLNSSHANISYAVFCLKKKKRQASTSYREL